MAKYVKITFRENPISGKRKFQLFPVDTSIDMIRAFHLFISLADSGLNPSITPVK